MKKVSVYFKNYSSCLCHVKQMVLGNNFVTLQQQHSTQLLSTGSFSKVVLSHRAVNQVFFGVFLMFLAFFHSKIWAKIHFGTFEPYKQEKHLKISS